jgi:protein arginine kinase activator
MQSKCDKCGKPAAVHLTDIVNGQKTEKHLCDQCAVAEGVAIKANIPISQLLEEFILQSSPSAAAEDPKCDVCGMTFADFRQQQLLGCPHDYDALDKPLRPLIERSHEGASQHVGKAPRQAGVLQRKQNAILRLRAALRGAVAAEDYEKAARIRDEIKRLEEP